MNNKRKYAFNDISNVLLIIDEQIASNHCNYP